MKKLVFWIILIIFLILILIAFFSCINFLILFIKLDSNKKGLSKEYFYTCFDDDHITQSVIEENFFHLVMYNKSNIKNLSPNVFVTLIFTLEKNIKCFCEKAISENIEITYDILEEECKKHKIENKTYKIPWIFPNIILIFSNIILEIILINVCDYLPFKFETTRRTFKCFFLFFIFSFNYFFIYFFYQNQKFIDFLLSFKYFEESRFQETLIESKFIYELHGDFILLTMMTEIFRGVMNFFANGGSQIWGLIFSKLRFNVKRKVVKWRTLPEFTIEGKIALLNTFLLVCIFFSCQIPILSIVGIFIFGPLLWAEKLVFVIMSSRPKLNSQVPIEFIIFMLPVFIVVSAMYNIHTYGHPRVFPTNKFYFFPNIENFEVSFFF